MKSGDVVVELDEEEVTAVAIFQYASGLEASVLPVSPGREFSLFVESFPGLDTGVAVYRYGFDPVAATLYDSNGRFIDRLDLDMAGRQSAQFLSQLFGVTAGFRGTLRLTSAELFAPLGIRFGRGALYHSRLRLPYFHDLLLAKRRHPAGHPGRDRRRCQHH